MSKVDELVINYAIYEDAVEYLGTTEVTSPIPGSPLHRTSPSL